MIQTVRVGLWCWADRDAVVAMRQAAVADTSTTVWTPLSPGYRGHPTPAVSCACGTWKPRQGPVCFGDELVRAGKPTVREAQFPGGNRMPKKRMPVAERRRETSMAWPLLQAGGAG